MEFRFDYSECQHCKTKAFCDRCQEDLAEKLLLEPEIRYVNLRLPCGLLTISSDLELPELEILLQKHGVNVH